MDEEETRDYREPCAVCADINWGISDEGKFYCRSCHTVIEKTVEVEESELFVENARKQSVSRGLKKKKIERGWEWYICEGFQFILLKQAEALEALGVDPRIKNEVMCNFWRRYLQKTGQAYCRGLPKTNELVPLVPQSSVGLSDQDSGPEALSTALSSDTDKELDSITLPSSGCETSSSGMSSAATSIGASSICSGSVDGMEHKKKKPWEKKMSMPLTLSFCYLSLLWLRESITLSDLLRLVLNRHVPYFNPEQYFPERTKIWGPDCQIFRVRSFPGYKEIIDLTHDLGKLLDLPRFPLITEVCFYHPNVLCMKYLMEANLPDELHNWTYRVAKKSGLDDVTTLTYDPAKKKPRCIPYDIQAVAIIIVVLKLLFVLDDKWEWGISDIASSNFFITNGHPPVFDFRKWYETMRPCMEEAQQKMEEKRSRFSWKSERVVHYGIKTKTKVAKRKQMTKNLLKQFHRLAGTTPDAGNQGPLTFLFNWEEENTSKISFHGHSLEGITQLGGNPVSAWRTYYWFNCLKKCTSQFCYHWKLYDRSLFSRSYDFILSLFSLMLGVEMSIIHLEVGLVEENLFKDFKRRKAEKDKKKKSKKSQT